MSACDDPRIHSYGVTLEALARLSKVFDRSLRDHVGILEHISGQPLKKTSGPICLKCKKDSGLDRVVWEGIYWPGTQPEWPDKDLRILIGREVFGPGYAEPD